VQLAARAGARVLCTVGTPEKAARAVELGAERAVLYREEDFVEVVREATGGAGADVVLDNMGAAYLPRNVDALAVGGRLVVIGLQGGTRGELDLGALLRKRAAVHATSLRARPAHEKAAIVAAVRAHVWPAVEAGEVVPVIDRVLPLDEAAQAHRVMESSAHIGKILLVCP
jgi:NADPH:quinone reductase-like Zn-dependent oxidoreductase